MRQRFSCQRQHFWRVSCGNRKDVLRNARPQRHTEYFQHVHFPCNFRTMFKDARQLQGSLAMPAQLAYDAHEVRLRKYWKYFLGFVSRRCKIAEQRPLMNHGWLCSKGRSKVMQTVALRERPHMSDGMKIKRAKRVSKRFLHLFQCLQVNIQ